MIKFSSIVTLALMTLPASPALADMSSAEFFARDRSHSWVGPLHAMPNPFGTVPKSIKAPRGAGRQMLAIIVTRQVTVRLGRQWTATALRLTRVESGFRCNAVGPRVRSHGGNRAQGPLQVMPRTARAMGFDPRRLTECEYGVAAGVEHMRRCIAAGVRTPAQMAACHVAGFAGWNRRISRRAESYKHRYVRMAMAGTI